MVNARTYVCCMVFAGPKERKSGALSVETPNGGTLNAGAPIKCTVHGPKMHNRPLRECRETKCGVGKLNAKIPKAAHFKKLWRLISRSFECGGFKCGGIKSGRVPLVRGPYKCGRPKCGSFKMRRF